MRFSTTVCWNYDQPKIKKARRSAEPLKTRLNLQDMPTYITPLPGRSFKVVITIPPCYCYKLRSCR